MLEMECQEKTKSKSLLKIKEDNNLVLLMKLERPVIVTTDKNVCGVNIRKTLFDNWDFIETEN